MPLSVYDRAEFLKNFGWGDASGTPVGEDWSQRKYFRIQQGQRSAILVHSVPDNDPRAVMGHKLCDFIDIGNFLRGLEMSVPEIYASDLSHGLMLIEDFGDQDFSKLIACGGDRQADLYKLATNALIHLYRRATYAPIDLPNYFDSHIHTGRRRVVDWYMPAVLKRQNPDGVLEDYLNVWKGIESRLPPVIKRFQHGDFHPGNIIYLPDRIKFRQVGLIDFQGGMMGPAPYDLVNLLEDARRFVPEDIKRDCLAHFIDNLSKSEKESFLAWYPVLAAQFHFRVIGQAIKLVLKNDITRLMDLLPVLSVHIQNDLKHPVLQPMKVWFDGQGITFSQEEQIDLKKVAAFMRPDAF